MPLPTSSRLVFFSPRVLLAVAAFACGALDRAHGAAATEPRAPISDGYSLREWHESDGLPTDEVARVLQDRAGFLWVATGEGLVRFDSVHFENHAERFKTAGAATKATALAEVPGLGLLCAPGDGGLLRRSGDHWERWPVVGDRAINSLFTEPDGTLWASCEDRTILRYQAGKLETFPAAALGSNRPIAYFATDDRHQLWIASGSFLGRYEAGQFKRNAAITGAAETRIASSRRGGIWILTASRLHKLVEGKLDAGTPIPALIGAHYAHTMFEDRTGALWIGTRSQGLFVFTAGKLFSVPTSSDDVRSISEDSEGNLWVGTNGGGLDRLHPRNFRLFDQAAGLLDNFSYTVCEDAEGTAWFGNRDGSVARFRNDRVEVLARNPGWKQLNAMSVFPDGSGKIWVTTGVGIFKVDPAAQDRLLRVDSVATVKLTRVSYVAKNGDYWISADPNRVGVVRGADYTTYFVAEIAGGQLVRCFGEDPSGAIWAGTADGRVFRFDGTRFVAVPLDDPEKLGPIHALLFDPDGVLWIATGRGGLGVLAGGKFQRFDTRHGLPDDRLTDLIRDDSGRFWFGSTSGIFSVHGDALAQLRTGQIKSVQAILVGRDDNIAGLSCLGMFKPSTWKDHAGRLWFATRKGVLMFDPANANTEVKCPPVFLSEVKFDDHPQPLASPLKIGGQVRKVELRLSVLRFTAPDRVQIRYRLHGFDTEWVTAGPDRIAAYPALPPGDYLFEAASSLSNGVWNEEGVSLAFTVVPRWWQSLWFYALVIALATTVVVFVVRTWSHRRLRRQVEELERERTIERERTRIARDMHDDLGASLSRISLLTQSARDSTPPFANSPLAQIYETVSEITRSMDEIVWAVNPRHDQLDSLASYLASHAQSLLSAAHIRCRLDLPAQLPSLPLGSHARHNLYLCLKESLHNVVKHSGADEVLIAMTVDAAALTLSVTDNGRGFDPARPRPVDPARPGGGNGLENLRRRAEEISGRCEIDSAPGRGTTVRFILPLGKHPAV